MGRTFAVLGLGRRFEGMGEGLIDVRPLFEEVVESEHITYFF